jgi:hypothetical protein
VKVSWGLLFTIYGKMNKKYPNHQPVMILVWLKRDELSFDVEKCHSKIDGISWISHETLVSTGIDQWPKCLPPLSLDDWSLKNRHKPLALVPAACSVVSTPSKYIWHWGIPSCNQAWQWKIILSSSALLMAARFRMVDTQTTRFYNGKWWELFRQSQMNGPGYYHWRILPRTISSPHIHHFPPFKYQGTTTSSGSCLPLEHLGLVDRHR